MTTKTKKTPSVKRLKAQVWDLCSQYVRMRDCLKATGDINFGHCITCNRFVRRSEGHAGHFIGRGHGATLFDETNVHLQCCRCNTYGGGEPLKYRREIVRLYGEGYDLLLEEKAMKTKRWSVEELLKLRADFTQKIKELEAK